jgi:hypothetical protein
LICQGELKKASRIYSNLFEQEKHPFFRDIQNALIVEIETSSDTSKIRSWLLKLLDQGFLIDTAANEGLSYYLLSNNKYSAVIKNWIKHAAFGKKHFISNADSIMSELIKLDQKIRRLCREKYNLSTYDSICLDTIQFIDFRNQEEIIRIISDDNWSVDSISWKNTIAISVMIQHSMSWNRFPTSELLFSSVLKGNFDPRIYADIVDKWYEFHNDPEDKEVGYYGKYGRHLGDYVGEYYFIILDTIGKTQFNGKLINENRKQIFLDDYLTEHKKKVYKNFFSKYPFNLVSVDKT